MSISKTQLTLKSSPQPNFGYPSSNDSVSISSNSVSDPTQISWEVNVPSGNSWGTNTYVLAVVLANPSSMGTGVDPGDFFAAGNGNLLLQEEGWTLPEESSAAGTGWVVVAPPSACTLTIVGEEQESVTFNYMVYLFSTDIGVWFVTDTLTLPGSSS